MGIDRIGKGPTPPLDGVAETSKSEGTGATFEVKGKGVASEVQGAEGVTAARVEAVRSGQMSLDAYIEAQIADATQGLQGLPRAKLHEVRELLRERLRADAELGELFEQATGARVPESEA